MLAAGVGAIHRLAFQVGYAFASTYTGRQQCCPVLCSVVLGTCLGEHPHAAWARHKTGMLHVAALHGRNAPPPCSRPFQCSWEHDSAVDNSEHTLSCMALS